MEIPATIIVCPVDVGRRSHSVFLVSSLPRVSQSCSRTELSSNTIRPDGGLSVFVAALEVLLKHVSGGAVPNRLRARL